MNTSRARPSDRADIVRRLRRIYSSLAINEWSDETLETVQAAITELTQAADAKGHEDCGCLDCLRVERNQAKGGLV